MNIHIDSFSNASIVDLKKSNRNERGVLNALNINPSISTWDMCDNPWLCDIIKNLKDKGMIKPAKSAYPWHKWKLTKSGKGAITI